MYLDDQHPSSDSISNNKYNIDTLYIMSDKTRKTKGYVLLAIVHCVLCYAAVNINDKCHIVTNRIPYFCRSEFHTSNSRLKF